MNTFNKLFSRKFYRTFPFWILFLITIYSVIGFFALPKIIHNTITEQVNKQLGWQTSINKIEVNPFLFTLTINELDISEAKVSAIAFTRFHADFELRSILEGAFTFKNVELLDPTFNLAIAKDGATNIQRALTQQQAIEVKNTAENKSETPFVIPKLQFDIISIKNGSLSATDNSQKVIIKHQLNSINFNLKSFSTYIKKGGDYQLHISMGNDQSLDWSGNLSVTPVSSQGSFAIKGIQADRLWPYIAPFSPYTLNHSEIDLQTNYELSYINNHFQLMLDEAFVTLSDTRIALKESTSDFFTINQVKVGPSKFNLTDQSIVIDKLSVDSINFDLLRNADGELEFLVPMNAFIAKNKSTSKPTAKPSQPFLWAVNTITVENSKVTFVDKLVKGGANIKIHNIAAELSMLNQSLSNKQPFSLSYQVESSDENSISGDLVAQPFKLDSNIELSNVSLKLVQPYLNELANVTIDKGTLSLKGKTKLTMHQKTGLQGHFDGQIAINEFDSQDTVINRRLLGWKHFEVTPIKVNLSPLSIDIDKVIINQPYSRLVITEDREVNFSQLMIDKKEQASTTKKSPAPQININEILVKSGSTYFADLSLQPQFGTSIQNMNGYVKGLSSNNLESAEVKINGTVEEYGKVLVEGKINPLSGDLNTDININFDKIELTTLAPYSGRYAGYVIDKGKLTLALNYKIAKGYLDGHNRLILDQFELGDAVESEESLDLPLKLALALFKDSDGIIDISLPTKGDMNSPDFEISGLIMKALLNVITKAVTSPFSLLANLAGGDEKSLSSVQFELAGTSLNQQQRDNLKTLADLLKERPQLILEVRVNVDSVQESLVLKQQAVQMQLDLQNKKQAEQIQIMEQSIIKAEGNKGVDILNTQLNTQQEPGKKIDPVVFDKLYHQSLFNHLVSLQPLSNIQLTELAQQRISVVKNELIKINKVDNSQIFALNPSLKGNAENARVTTTFNLTSK